MSIDLEDLIRADLHRVADEGPPFVAPSDLSRPDPPSRPATTRLLAAACAAVLVGVGVVVLGQRLLDPAESGGSAECASFLRYDGHRFLGTGILHQPRIGVVLGEGAIPGCSDGNGPAGPDRRVEVHAVRGADPAKVVAVDGDVYVKQSLRTVPDLVRRARIPVRCSFDGTTTLTGRWVAVTSSREVRFDGDVRPPFRIEFVTSDPRVVGEWAVVTLRARGVSAEAAPSVAQVRSMLWNGRTALLTTHCEDGRFVVEKLTET